MNLEINYDPLPGQKQFHELPNLYRAYIGGVGAGKTMCGCMEAIMLSLEYPGNFGLIGAQTYPQLTDTTMRTFFDCLYERVGYNRVIKSYSKTERHLYFNNGSEVIFRTLDDEGKLKSLNLGFFYIDEASEVPESTFFMLQGRLRLHTVPRRVGFVTTNSEGHNWIWRNFVRDRKKDYAVVVAPSEENIYLPPGYIDSLLNNYPPDWIDRYVYAKFNVFEGMVWKEWDERIHVIQNFNPPKLWNRGIAIDYGMRNPTAIGFFATDEERNVILYDEYYETEMLVSEHAKNLKTIWEMEFGKKKHLPIDIWIDPTTREREGITGQSILAEFSDNGVYCSLANNDVRAGILKVAEYMKPRVDWKRPSWAIPLTYDHLKYAKTVGSPMFYVCERCRISRQEIAEYQWKKLGTALTEKQDPQEKPRKKEDHCADMIRYFLMTQPDPTETIAKIKPPTTQTERVWLDLKRRTKEIDPKDIPPTNIMTPEQLGTKEGFDGLE